MSRSAQGVRTLHALALALAAMGTPRAQPAEVQGRVVALDPFGGVLVAPEAGEAVVVRIGGTTAVSPDLEERMVEGAEVRASYEPETGRALDLVLVRDVDEVPEDSQWLGAWFENRAMFEPGFSVHETPFGESTAEAAGTAFVHQEGGVL